MSEWCTYCSLLTYLWKCWLVPTPQRTMQSLQVWRRVSLYQWYLYCQQCSPDVNSTLIKICICVCLRESSNNSSLWVSAWYPGAPWSYHRGIQLERRVHTNTNTQTHVGDRNDRKCNGRGRLRWPFTVYIYMAPWGQILSWRTVPSVWATTHLSTRAGRRKISI